MRTFSASVSMGSSGATGWSSSKGSAIAAVPVSIISAAIAMANSLRNMFKPPL